MHHALVTRRLFIGMCNLVGDRKGQLADVCDIARPRNHRGDRLGRLRVGPLQALFPAGAQIVRGYRQERSLATDILAALVVSTFRMLVYIDEREDARQQ